MMLVQLLQHRLGDEENAIASDEEREEPWDKFKRQACLMLSVDREIDVT